MTFRLTLYGLFCSFIVLNALSSVAIAGIPLPWIGLAGTIAIAIRFWYPLKELRAPFYLPLGLLMAWLLVNNVARWTEFEPLLPVEASSSYEVYIALRYLAVLSFIGSVVLVVRLCATGHEQRLVAFLVGLGSVLATYAIYVYFAQLHGWPELLPRSRMGTGGGEQSVTFTYAFHRAMGSFREPSHLAEWLMTPFALSFVHRGRYLAAHKLLMGVAILLTGSMTGIMALLIGLVAAYGLIYVRTQPVRFSQRSLVRVAGAAVVLAGLVYAVNLALSGLLLETVATRSQGIIEGGMAESNRNYVYEYFANTPVPLTGTGLGNANINFSAATANDLISSFLSLYLNTLYSGGYFGFALLVWLLAVPLCRVYRNVRQPGAPIFVLVWAYCAWLVAFSVHSEEFSAMFGVTYGLLLWHLMARARARQAVVTQVVPRPVSRA